MASRSLEDLTPGCRAKAKQFLEECDKQGLDILIYCTLRPGVEQDALYALGRTKPGKIVTNARAGESYHNYGMAFDFVPVVGGKPQWDNTELYRKAGVIAESIGLEWAGRWTGKLRETAHCQYTGGITLAQLQSGVKIT